MYEIHACVYAETGAVVTVLFPVVSTIGYTLWLGLGWRFFLALLWVLFGDCLVVGSVIASIMW